MSEKMSNDVKLYNKQIFDYCDTLIVKFDLLIYHYNKMESFKLGRQIKQSENTYLLNLDGRYGLFDEPIKVKLNGTSVVLTKELVDNNTVLTEIYKEGSIQLQELLYAYPDKVDLIRCILFKPLDRYLSEVYDKLQSESLSDYQTRKISERYYKIEKVPDLTILYSDESLLDEQERVAIFESVLEYNRMFKDRFMVQEFKEEDFYTLAINTIYLSNLRLFLLAKRIDLIKTSSTCDFHIWEHLSQYGLDKFKDLFSTKQKVFLYKNIDYLIRNIGRKDLLPVINKHILKEFNLELNDFVMALKYKDFSIDNLNDTKPPVETDVMIISKSLNEYNLPENLNEKGLSFLDFYSLLRNNNIIDQTEFNRILNENDFYALSNTSRIDTKYLDLRRTDAEETVYNEFLEVTETEKETHNTLALAYSYVSEGVKYLFGGLLLDKNTVIGGGEIIEAPTITVVGEITTRPILVFSDMLVRESTSTIKRPNINIVGDNTTRPLISLSELFIYDETESRKIKSLDSIPVEYLNTHLLRYDDETAKLFKVRDLGFCTVNIPSAPLCQFNDELYVFNSPFVTKADTADVVTHKIEKPDVTISGTLTTRPVINISPVNITTVHRNTLDLTKIDVTHKKLNITTGKLSNLNFNYGVPTKSFTILSTSNKIKTRIYATRGIAYDSTEIPSDIDKSIHIYNVIPDTMESFNIKLPADSHAIMSSFTEGDNIYYIGVFNMEHEKNSIKTELENIILDQNDELLPTETLLSDNTIDVVVSMLNRFKSYKFDTELNTFEELPFLISPFHKIAYKYGNKAYLIKTNSAYNFLIDTFVEKFRDYLKEGNTSYSTVIDQFVDKVLDRLNSIDMGMLEFNYTRNTKKYIQMDLLNERTFAEEKSYGECVIYTEDGLVLYGGVSDV